MVLTVRVSWEACDIVATRLSSELYGWLSRIFGVSLRRYLCRECAQVQCQYKSQAAEQCVRSSRAALCLVLTGVVVHYLTVARVVEGQGESLKIANTAVRGGGARQQINDPA